MHVLPLFLTGRVELRRAEPAVGPATPAHPTVQADLVDPSHGLALGYEAALLHLFDALAVEAAARAG